MVLKMKKENKLSNNGANKRLQQFRKSLGMTQTQFAEAVSITQANLSFLENNPGHTPSGHLIQNIITAFPDLNLNWWFFGEGEMLRSDEFKAMDNAPDDVRLLLKEVDKLKIEKQIMEVQLNSLTKENAFLQRLLLKEK